MVRDLNKRYGNGTWANRDINLTVEPGEIVGILGSNGAGKTTLVRQITTELLPTSGEVRVLNHSVVAEPYAVKTLLGIVPQEATLFDYLTVQQHLRIFGKLRGLHPVLASQRAEALIAELQISGYRTESIRTLSGGLRRRILIGIAFLAEPHLAVLDEPTTGLDPQSRRDVWALLRRYRDRGTTVLLTTHYMEEAEALCDRVGIIQNGQLLALDSVDNLRNTQRHQAKITYVPNGTSSEPVTIYGVSSQELVDRVRSEGIDHFSVARTNLEDIYLELTGRQENFDDRAN